jgi:hypothetical protein
MPSPLVILKAKNYSGSGPWNDESGNSNNATLEGGRIAVNAVGNGIILNGSTSWTFPNPAVGNAWTANVWYKNTGKTIAGNSCILTQLFASGAINMAIGYIDSTDLKGGFFNGAFQVGSIVKPVTRNTWQNIQVTWDGVNIKTYVNSTLIGSTIATGAAPDAGYQYRIGRRWDIGDPADYVTGEIGELRIYGTALSQAEVTADYNSSVATFPSPLILLRAVDYSGSGSWNDSSTQSNNATLEQGIIAKNPVGNGIILDGTTSWTFPDITAGNTWTASVWFKQTAPSIYNLGSYPYAHLLTQKFVSVSSMNLTIGETDATGTFGGGFLKSGAWYRGSNITLETNTWINIQVTYDGVNMKTYINSALLGSVALSTSTSTNGAAYLLGRRWDGASFMVGELGEVRIYRQALNQLQVIEDYKVVRRFFTTR